jgi:hypothetical protein
MLRETRDGMVTLVGPLHMPPSASDAIALNLASILLVPAVILLVWWTVGSGFSVTPTMVVEPDARVRSYE